METPDVPLGAPLKFEGHEYTITAADARGVFRFDRPEGLGPGDTPKRAGLGNVADLRQAPEGWWFLPWRVAPRLSGVLQGLLQRGIPADVVAAIKSHVQSHLAYLEHGRDDLALADALAAHLPSEG